MPRLTLGLGDLAASGRSEDALVTTGLGSCVAVVVRDRVYAIAALAHVVVPGAPPPNDAGRPAWYAERAVPGVLQAFRDVGGERPEVLLVGGATAVQGLTSFDIGRRNLLAIRRELWRRGLVAVAEEVEGEWSRSLSILVATGDVEVRSPGQGTINIRRAEQERS